MLKPEKRTSDAELPVTAKIKKGSQKPTGEPLDVAAITRGLQEFLNTLDAQGRRIGSSPCGVYAFYDYDGEPIYIGQTYLGLSDRIGRHLSGRRSDAVAKNILDPFEVAEVRVWPMDLSHLSKTDKKIELNRAEYTLYLKVIEESSFHAVLNEKLPRTTELIALPTDYRGRIIPDDIFPQRKHPDIRIARRANTIAALARVISERKVGKRLRTILLTQAQRLESLATKRLADFAGAPDDADDESESKD